MFPIVCYAENGVINILVHVSLGIHQGFLRTVLFKCCYVYKSHVDLLNVDSDSVSQGSFLTVFV